VSRYAETRAALLARLATATGVPDTTQWAEENVVFEPTIGEAWLAVRFSPGEERLITMPAQDGWKELPGVLRVLMHRPLREAVASADTVAQAILDSFAPGTTLTNGATTIHIDVSRRYSGGRDIDDSWYTVPIDIRWHVRTINTLT